MFFVQFVVRKKGLRFFFQDFVLKLFLFIYYCLECGFLQLLLGFENRVLVQVVMCFKWGFVIKEEGELIRRVLVVFEQVYFFLRGISIFSWFVDGFSMIWGSRELVWVGCFGRFCYFFLFQYLFRGSERNVFFIGIWDFVILGSQFQSIFRCFFRVIYRLMKWWLYFIV